jgi:predicted Rossmann fold flavoprotein
MGNKRLIVIGGGAAGMFCAVNAARMAPGLQVIVLEKTGKLLQKVKISGGGRCNVTHHCFEKAVLVKNYPRGEQFLKKAFYRFSTSDTVNWFKERGVVLKTEADGRMFPVTDSSQTIIDALLREADRYGVEIRLNCTVKSIEKQPDAAIMVHIAGQLPIRADYVVVATGGFPKKEMFDLLTQFTGHQVASPVPSLFTFNLPGNTITRLMGIACPVRLKIAGTAFMSEGPMLITHWGISGPAVLRTSAFAARYLHDSGYSFTVLVNWLPQYNEASLRQKILVYRQEKGTRKVANTEWIDLPERLWRYLLEQCGINPNQKWADLPAALQNKLIKVLTAFELEAKGKTTFKEEFVTAGGILLSEIDPNTMQSRKMSGLYFAGEIMDVDGVTGGFNFQHAWTSGYIAACSVASQTGMPDGK